MSDSLRERALRLLARRDHSREELRRKLAAAGGPDAADEVEALLDDLAARQLLSDERFAEHRTHQRSARYGNARLAQELRNRGVDAGLIEQAIDAVGDETTRATAVWRKKFATLPASREEWAKQARFLHARGFSAETIRCVLKRGIEPDD